MAAARILHKAKSFASRKPLLVNSVVYGFFYTGAEFARQSYHRITETKSVTKKFTDLDKEESKVIRIQTTHKTLDSQTIQNSKDQFAQYDWTQLKRYAIYGCLLAGPVLHGWYKWLDSFYRDRTAKTIVKKLLADQFVFTPGLIVLFFISMDLMEGKPDIFDECKVKFLKTFQTSCMYWLPVQFLNFKLIPPTFRVFFVSVAAFCWVNILCYLKSVPLSEYNK